MPPLHETADDLKGLLKAARAAPHQPRLHALYLLQTEQARTRRQVAPRLGVRRKMVSCWRAADATGGIAQMLTIATAPGQVPRVSPAMQAALRQRLAHPTGVASYQAIWPWLPHDDGLAMAYTTGPRLVR
jgi:hypothetical protein